MNSSAKDELEILFRQWCNNEIADKDIERLMNLLFDADRDEILSPLMRDVYQQIRNESFFTEEEKKKIFLYATQQKPPYINTRRKWIIGISLAASFILLFGMGYFFYYSKNRSKISVNNIVDVQDILAPTHYNGLLKLGVNSEILFDKITDGIIAKQENVIIEKHANGILSFNGIAKKIITNTLAIPKGSKLMHLQLADGTLVVLNAGSTLTFPNAFTSNERKVSLRGEAYFEVKHDSKHPFIVDAGKSRIKVLGTHFNVNAYDDELYTKVTLIEGKVNVDDRLTLKPGEQAIIEEKRTTLEVDPDIQAELSWTNNEFVFNSADIETILSTLSKWYNFTIEYKSSVPQGHFTGTFDKSNSLSQVLKILEAGGLHFQIEDSKLIVL